MIFVRKVILFTICSISINNYSMDQVVKEQDNKNLIREVVIRRFNNSLNKTSITHSLTIDFSRYVYAFLKDDNTLWFNFQNGVILEENNQRARIVFKTLTKQQKPDFISFSPKTHANFEKIKLSNEPLLNGAQIISLSELKSFKNDSSYADVVFDVQQLYMRHSPSKTIPLNGNPLSDGSGFFFYNKEKRVTFKRVKLFQFDKKVTVMKY